MSNTADYNRRFQRAKLLRESAGREIRPDYLNEEFCPECHSDPCECPDEGHEEIVPRESMETVELLAVADPHTFAFMAESAGLRVAPLRGRDPLNRKALAEDISAIASTMTSDPTDHPGELDNYQRGFREVAQACGYMIL